VGDAVRRTTSGPERREQVADRRHSDDDDNNTAAVGQNTTGVGQSSSLQSTGEMRGQVASTQNTDQIPTLYLLGVRELRKIHYLS